MTIALRAEVLKAAFEDPETRKKLEEPTLSWKDMQKIIAEFAKKKGFRVVQL
jgi:short subunit dehydrogenase-like uncharacterized protein